MSSKNFRYNKNIKHTYDYKDEDKYIEKLSKDVLEYCEKLSNVGIKLLFVGNGILIFDNNKKNQLRSGIINIVGVTILAVSGVIQILENYIDKNPLPEKINREKFLGIMLSLTGNFILTKILIIEYNLHEASGEMEDTLVD